MAHRLVFVAFSLCAIVLITRRSLGVSVGTRDFGVNKGQAEPRVLVVVPLKNAIEHIYEHFALLSSLSYPAHQMSIAFLVSDTTDGTYERAQELALYYQNQKGVGWHSISVFRKDFLDENEEQILREMIIESVKRFGWEDSESLRPIYDKSVSTNTPLDVHQLLSNAPNKLRHSLALQPARRRLLAKSRTFLLSVALREEDWVVWLDVDVVQVKKSLIQDLLMFAQLGNAQVVAPNCMWKTYNEMGGYDRNSWTETENSKAYIDTLPPNITLFEGYASLPTGRQHLINHPLAINFPPRHTLLYDHLIVDLDGVGACALLVEANTHREGAIFPHWPVDRQVESEGLAKIAKIGGKRVVGLPTYHVYHGLYG